MTIKKMRRAFIVSATTLAVSLGWGSVLAQTADETYPNQPIKFIVPYTPGGSNDVVARIVGQKLSSYWGQSVIVENKPGAGGNLGASAVARSAPDGYTLLITPNNLLTMNPALYKKSGAGYDAVKDFSPISLIATGPILLAVSSEVPVNSVSELIAYARGNPDKLSYASAGIGTPHHLTAEMLKSMAGIRMVHIPYRGAVAAVGDLAAGRVHVMFGIPNTLMPFVKTGQIKALGVSSLDMDPSLPDVPTIASSGLPGFDSTLWIGLVAPSGTPQAVIDKINMGIAKAMQEPDVRSALEAQGLSPASNSSEAFDALIQKDAARWSNLIEAEGITAE